mgnify:CR=1 FL=1
MDDETGSRLAVDHLVGLIEKKAAEIEAAKDADIKAGEAAEADRHRAAAE